ncbi:hypothetical protein QQY66_20225 [Streptomyces sp. DG2A-72]|nr:hypothetical protein [Streptomyces sp. DG2A-72]MDO0933897.1 hypothetical protein [Streptomyces sp. DG2A-72]
MTIASGTPAQSAPAKPPMHDSGAWLHKPAVIDITDGFNRSFMK